MVRVIVNPSASGISLDKGDKSLVVEYSYDTLWRRYEKKTNTENYKLFLLFKLKYIKWENNSKLKNI